MKARVELLWKQNQYYQTRYERESGAFFHSLESLMAYYQDMKPPNTELIYLANAFLNVLAKDGESTVDPLHYIVNEQFSHDPRIIGPVVKLLKSVGLIVECGYRKSERKRCHGRPISVWKLTDKGSEAVQ